MFEIDLMKPKCSVIEKNYFVPNLICLFAIKQQKIDSMIFAYVVSNVNSYIPKCTQHACVWTCFCVCACVVLYITYYYQREKNVSCIFGQPSQDRNSFESNEEFSNVIYRRIVNHGFTFFAFFILSGFCLFVSLFFPPSKRRCQGRCKVYT